MKTFFFCLCFVFLVSLPVGAENLVSGSFSDKRPQISLTDKRVVQTSKSIRHLMKLAPGREIMKNRDYRMGMALSIVLVALETGVPVHLLTILVFLESSFEESAVGPGGELGLGQVMHPNKYGCNMDTRLGQLRCSAQYLKRGYKKCGTWEGAIANYGSKYGTCKPKKGGKLYKVVNYRMRKWAKVRRLFPLDDLSSNQ